MGWKMITCDSKGFFCFWHTCEHVRCSGTTDSPFDNSWEKRGYVWGKSWPWSCNYLVTVEKLKCGNSSSEAQQQWVSKSTEKSHRARELGQTPKRRIAGISVRAESLGQCCGTGLGRSDNDGRRLPFSLGKTTRHHLKSVACCISGRAQPWMLSHCKQNHV